MSGPFRNRTAELCALRKRTPRYRVPFPSLHDPECTSPCSDVIAVPGSLTPKRTRSATLSPEFVVDTTHKQGPSVHHIRESKYLGGRKI